ncbi:MAG: PTS sugar transporter subunit IIA [Candidatus Aminicenantes bacterium]|nr:PTS sugar transporter subunit IIA [Candidatus Aminicenantes bacterium]
MNVTRYLKPGRIVLDLKAADKRSGMEELMKIFVDSGAVPKGRTDDLLRILIERENQSSTGLGNGIALPHAKTDMVDRILVAFGLSREGIDFQSPDGEPAHFIFLVLAPTNESGEYLKALAAISTVMKDKSNRRRLLHAKTLEEALKIFNPCE